ncbi:type I restriction endonuclease subunit R [Lewinella sp. W8]|uniref:type I restriction endonuclease subunit R n=1 Tax=Lewinella sp. W8 TaxID=2528208 RepID=UPI00106893FE|nr:type I restriction endonuclease subunit R [Lewinella sp. W8]MTB51863.1 HsdR family type I site-specific deoxyribonuclease [Lewinella sp. W8]
MQVSDRERATQERVLNQLNLELGWQYLGNWQYRENSRCVERKYLEQYLQKRGYAANVIQQAIDELMWLVEDQSRDLYPINMDVYRMLRYGIQVKPGVGENEVDVNFIDWDNFGRNDYYCAEEVSVAGVNNKRPDIVLYINGIALGVMELKRSSVSVAEGIRQLYGNQKEMYIRPFFHTSQLLVAANESQGLRYGTTLTPEKYYLQWKEETPTRESGLLRREIAQLLNRQRFHEIVKNYILFDGGVKKVCRPHQFFGIQAARARVQSDGEGAARGGIIWHTQGSGKSLTMVWLARWIIENVTDSRVVVITDRDELDKQIVRVFDQAGDDIRRAKSGADLLKLLNEHQPALICSLVHKFGTQLSGGKEVSEEDYAKELRAALPRGFRAKGNVFVFVDECHRTQSGKLNEAMKEVVLPEAVFIGFTGTPLMARDKKRSIEVFGSYIGTPYKFDQAVADGVVLDLRYEARDINQRISNQTRVDEWFDANTQGLNDIARHQLKQKWGTLQKVLSSKSRLDQIVMDINLDFISKPRLKEGQGNAMLVAGSVYEACRYYQLFQETDLAAHCAIVTSYSPSAGKVSKEDSGEGTTEELLKYEVYRKMLGDKDPEAFEREAKHTFINEPGRMKLLIVVDKLLTGFDAPSATYLYIDKSMRDHGLFQAICRVNRLDGEGKDYGYIIDYKDLFKSLEKSITDYTSEAFDNYDAEDVAGLIVDRIAAGRERLDDALDACEALIEPIGSHFMEPQMVYFCGQEGGPSRDDQELQQRRKVLYKLTAELSRAYAALANDMAKAGYTDGQTSAIKSRVVHFEKLRQNVQLRSNDRIDMKMYEAKMRRLIDMYIIAEHSRKISELEDFSLIELIVEKGKAAIASLPENIRASEDNIAETINANIRDEIVEKRATNPEFFERMSSLLEEIIRLREAKAIEYEEYLKRIVEFTRELRGKGQSSRYPENISTPRQVALYDNLGKDEVLAMMVEDTLRLSARDGWNGHPMKERAVEKAVEKQLEGTSFSVDEIMAILKKHENG